MTTVKLETTLVGTGVGSSGYVTNIFRVDLSRGGLGSISTITIQDDQIMSGWSGANSGFDLDFVKLSSTITDSAQAVISLIGDALFDFSLNGVVFEPGYIQPLKPGDDPSWNRQNLNGTTVANRYDPTLVDFEVAGAKTGGSSLSLGDGGRLTFVLPTPVSTSGKYLYIADVGGFDRSAVLISDGLSGVGLDDPTQFTVRGTAASDTIVLGVGLNVHLARTNNTVFGLGGNDRLTGALADDRLYGGGGNDRLVGRSGNDWLYGDAGNDTLSGGTGQDWLFGGTGLDNLYGGYGPDGFVFNSKPNTRYNIDRIYDYNPKADTIYLDDAVFKKLGKGSLADPVNIKKGLFWAGAQAHDPDDRILYDKYTGALSYDYDGDGAAAAVQFAQLSKNLTITYKEFYII